MLALQATAGNQAVVRALARQAAEFNPESIVHDLRRAIDQAEVSDGLAASGPLIVATKRKVDAALVIRALGGLSRDQITQVKTLYSGQEGSTLENDLFGRGQSGYESNLKPDQRARIQVLLKGGAAASSEAVAVELHELLSGGVGEAERERVMALYRRPVAEIEAFEAHYGQRYGHGVQMDLVLKLPGLQLSRVMALRAGNAAMADAYAIEDKTRALDELRDKRDAKDLSISEAIGYEATRRRLIDGITGIADASHQEGRLKSVMATPSASGGKLEDRVAGTLKGTEAAGIVASMSTGSRVETAARRLLEMEARDTTSAARIRELIEDLRAHGGRLDEFIATYNRLKPADGRSWAKIVASADPENEEMLKALIAGGGRMAPVDELRFAIRKRDAARINAVLRAQGTRENVKQLETAYNARFNPDLRHVLFGMVGAESAMESAFFAPATVRGRDAALADEYLNAPSAAELGGEKEVDWIAASALREAKASKASSGLVGSARDLWAPALKPVETKGLMQHSEARIRALQQAWKDNRDNKPTRDAILAELKRVRATLSGDAAAYDDENEQLREQIRSAVSLAVQAGLALLPGVGTGLSGLITTTALNIGATVASNAIIFDEKYSLKMLYDDVVGNAFGALGSKLGDDAARLLGKQLFGDAAGALSRTMTAAGRSREVAKRFARASLAEAGNIAGSTAATSAVTGNNGFTADDIFQNVLMNRLGHLRGKPHTPAGEQAPAHAEAAPGHVAADAARFESGLPADLRGRRMVVVDAALKAGDVKVDYSVLPPGVVAEVHLRVGAGTDPHLIRDHVPTVRAIQRYAGFSGLLRALLRRAAQFLTGHPQAGPGTKAWEVRLEVDKLRAMVSDRVRGLVEGGHEAGAAAKLDSDIANLKSQLEHYQREMDAIEADPAKGLARGKGHVAALSAESWYPAVRAEIRAIESTLRGRPDLLKTFEEIAEGHRNESNGEGFEIWVRSAAGRNADSLARELTDAGRRIRDLAANRFPPEDGVAPRGWTPPPQEYRPPPPGRRPNAAALPFPTEAQQRTVDEYAHALSQLRSARARLAKAATDEQRVTAETDLRVTRRRLDTLEAQIRRDPLLVRHTELVLPERHEIAHPRRPNPTDVGRIVTGPIATVGGRLRGQPYAEVRARLGAPNPNDVEPPNRGRSGVEGQTGAGKITWRIYDPLTGALSGAIRLDAPTHNDAHRHESANSVHLARELPDGLHIDEQGIVVPARSTSAHIEILHDKALEDEFAEARKRRNAAEAEKAKKREAKTKAPKRK